MGNPPGRKPTAENRTLERPDSSDDSLFESPVFENSTIGLQVEQLDTPEIAVVRRSAPHSVPNVFPNVDPFANINACTPEQIQQLAKILEIRGSQPRQKRMREACFNAAGIGAGVSVLEIGAGTGIVTRELSRITGRGGRVVGVDVSPALLAYARGRPVPSGAPIEYVVGDAYNLAFPDRAFDASCCVTLLAHLDDLDRAVAEMIRVTRTTVMLLDQDYQTLVFENSDHRLTRKILQHCADYNVIDGWCGRRLPGVLVRHGVQNVQCWPFVYCERDSHSYLITIAERFAALAVRHSVITQEAGRVWLQELYDRAVEGTFFASLNYYFAFGVNAPE